MSKDIDRNSEPTLREKIKGWRSAREMRRNGQAALEAAKAVIEDTPEARTIGKATTAISLASQRRSPVDIRDYALDRSQLPPDQKDARLIVTARVSGSQFGDESKEIGFMGLPADDEQSSVFGQGPSDIVYLATYDKNTKEVVLDPLTGGDIEMMDPNRIEFLSNVAAGVYDIESRVNDAELLGEAANTPWTP